MARRGETWVSEELQRVLAQLSPQQAAGVLRIVQAELEGRSLSSLLDREGQICTSTTFYGSGKRKGWRHKPEFNQALELARRDYRKWLLEYGVGDALAILAGAAPEAARALRQQVAGDPAAAEALKRLLVSPDTSVREAAALELGATGLPEVVDALERALIKETDIQVRKALVEALGRVAGWKDGERRSAAISILDRADVKTAAKRAFALGAEDLDAAIERELERLASGGEGEAVRAAESDDDVSEIDSQAGSGAAGLDA
jgi:hypothetical protein